MARKKAGLEELNAVLNNHTASKIIDRNNAAEQEKVKSARFERVDGLILKVTNYAGRKLAFRKSIFKNGRLKTVAAGTVWEDIPAEFKPGGKFDLSFSERDFAPAAIEGENNA